MNEYYRDKKGRLNEKGFKEGYTEKIVSNRSYISLTLSYSDGLYRIEGKHCGNNVSKEFRTLKLMRHHVSALRKNKSFK